MGGTTSGETTSVQQPAVPLARREGPLPADLEQTTVSFSGRPIGEGVSRIALSGELKARGKAAARWYYWRRRGDVYPCVVKCFKDGAQRARDQNDLAVDVQNLHIAEKFARRFNARNIANKPLHFPTPVVATVGKVPESWFLAWSWPTTPLVKGEWVVIEPYLPGKYRKLNSNNGWVDPAAKLAQAFSHFTYCDSMHTQLVCDLQGVRDGTDYMLTDPAIHSRTANGGEYGSTDCGIRGMVSFFNSHRCNEFCDVLGIRGDVLVLPSVTPLPVQKNTTYTSTLVRYA